MKYYDKVFKFQRYSDFNYQSIMNLYPYEVEINSALTVKALKKEGNIKKNGRKR